MNTAFKCAYGQLLAVVLGISIFCQDKLIKKHAPPFYFMYIFVHMIILIVSSIRLRFVQSDLQKRPKIYIYILPCVLDLLGGLFLSKSFNGNTDYLIALITQFIYPMSVATEFLVFKKNNFNFIKMGTFVALCLICFCVNRLQDDFDILCTVKGVCFALIANACYVGVTFLEADILPELDANIFMRDFAIIGIIFGTLYTVTTEYTNPALWTIAKFYKEHILSILSYAVPLSMFYLFAARFINSFGSTAYNASIITESAYIGLLHTFKGGKVNLWVIVGFSICIITSSILVAMEKNVLKKQNLSTAEK